MRELDQPELKEGNPEGKGRMSTTRLVQILGQVELMMAAAAARDKVGSAGEMGEMG